MTNPFLLEILIHQGVHTPKGHGHGQKNYLGVRMATPWGSIQLSCMERSISTKRTSDLDPVTPCIKKQDNNTIILGFVQKKILYLNNYQYSILNEKHVVLH